MKQEQNKDIENRFSYHRPNETQQEKYVNIRGEAKTFAYMMDNLCPDSREKSLAMTKLQEAVTWANASIACDEQPNVCR